MGRRRSALLDVVEEERVAFQHIEVVVQWYSRPEDTLGYYARHLLRTDQLDEELSGADDVRRKINALLTSHDA